MKLFHISDLHIGKRVNGFSMLEDQKYILDQIVKLAEEHRPDGILIAGDLYDRSMPSAEAVELADDFLYQFTELQIPVFLISGNHDCAERIAYGGRMMEQAGVYVARVFDGRMQKYTVTLRTEKEDAVIVQNSNKRSRYTVCTGTSENTDMVCVQNSKDSDEACVQQSKVSDEKCVQNKGEPEYVDIWLLPYIKPAQVRRFYPEEEIETTQQAVEVILKHTELDRERINILVMHQFLAGASVCESEEMSVGGSDQVDVSVVSAFDYVALGHLHGPQKVGRDTVRYSGSPLKYSFSEAGHRKSVTVVEIQKRNEEIIADDVILDRIENESTETAAAEEVKAQKIVCEEQQERKNMVRISQLPLIPRLDLREIRGPIDELLRPEIYEAANPQDYLHVTLTDREEVLDAIGRLRDVYPNIMRLDFASSERQQNEEQKELVLEEKSPMELFAEFFMLQNGYEMSEEQGWLIREILGEDTHNASKTDESTAAADGQSKYSDLENKNTKEKELEKKKYEMTENGGAGV